MTEKEMILSEPRLPTIQQELSPREIVEIASEQARVLMDIVEKQKLYEEIKEKKYLYVEGWQTIGAFTRTNALTDWVNPIAGHDGETTGYEAKVCLFRDGQIISAAVMSCGFDDFPCRGKEGSAKHKAAKSAAQTWAESKAYRMKYGYIAKLAGYEATPAEEMVSRSPNLKKTSPLVAAAKEHGAVEIPGFPKLNKKYGISLEFCWLHNNADWKSRKYGLSHKTEDGWCNFREAIKPIVKELAEKQGWDAVSMNNEIKTKYDGRTWSKLTEDEQCLFLESLITAEEGNQKPLN